MKIVGRFALVLGCVAALVATARAQEKAEKVQPPKEISAAPTAESLARGRAILASAVDAAGGAGLAKIGSLAYSGSGEATMPQGPIAVELKIEVLYPERIHSEVKLPFGTILTGFDGKAGWLSSSQGVMDWPVNLNAELQRGVDVSGGVGIYRLAAAGSLQAAFVGEEDVDGKKALAVICTVPSGPLKLFFDPQTHLLIGAHYQQKTPQGTFDTQQVWSDYRKVDDFQFPFHAVVYRDGSKFIESKIQDLKVNAKVDPALFARPQ